jgi:hypothetical protein
VEAAIVGPQYEELDALMDVADQSAGSAILPCVLGTTRHKLRFGKKGTPANLSSGFD